VYKEIVFINQNAGYLMVDIVNAHRHQYQKRTLLAGRIIERNVPLDPDVKVSKIIQYDRASSVRRIFTWGWAFLQILIKIKLRYRDADLYIVSNPPLATFLPLFCKNRFFILSFDLYPDVLVEYGMFKPNSPIVRWWNKKNLRIFTRASKIFTLSEGMRTILLRSVNEEKISVVPLWTDNTFFKPVRKEENVFRMQHALQGKFVVMYSGNLGYTHLPEVLIEMAKRSDNPDVIFLIVGEGDKQKSLQSQINSHQLTNCIMLPWQSVEMLRYSLAAADLAVVTLGRGASLLSVPSKTFNFLSVGVPILCVANSASEVASLVARYEIGKHFEESEVDQMLTFVNELYLNKSMHKAYSQRSLEASHEFTSVNAGRLVAKHV
jgi:glycosyltransferase involved in cell wall biosynthesis